MVGLDKPENWGVTAAAAVTVSVVLVLVAELNPVAAADT